MSTRSLLRPGQTGSGESVDANGSSVGGIGGELCCQVPPSGQRRGRGPAPWRGWRPRAEGSLQVTVGARLFQMQPQPASGEVGALITALCLPAGARPFSCISLQERCAASTSDKPGILRLT